MRVFALGLDGVPCSLLTSYVEKGYLPNFKNLLHNGFKLHSINSAIPELSSVAWTSFMTATNPGKHGIYGFIELAPHTYKLYFPNSMDIQAPKIWEKFKKYKSVIINLPQTYPAQPMNGILITGFVTPDLKKGTYPESTYHYLRSINYVVDVDAEKIKVNKDEFLRDLFLIFKKRKQVINYFFEKEKWDLFIAVITLTDRLNHFFFDAAFDQNHPYHEKFVSLYQMIDNFLGEIFEKFIRLTSGNGFFLTLSDHGFCQIKQEVYVNSFLKKEGFLKINDNEKFFEKIDRGTIAFAMDPARIYINLKNKYPKGTVKKKEKKLVMNKLKDLLRSLKNESNKPVFQKIYESKKIYHGPLIEEGPDLVCLPNEGFDLKATLEEKEIFGKGHFTGMHTFQDAHCILPANTTPPHNFCIEDVGKIITDALKQ